MKTLKAYDSPEILLLQLADVDIVTTSDLSGGSEEGELPIQPFY